MPGTNTSYTQESVFSVPSLVLTYDINTKGIWESLHVCL